MGIWDEFAASDAYKDDDLSNIMVIFGGTGDLAKRKIFPALYHLLRENTLPEKFAIVAIGRRQKNNEEYREYIYNFMKKELNIKIDEEVWSNLSQRIYYLPFKFEDSAGYERLKNTLKNLENTYHTHGNRIYYLAVAPEYFGVIVNQLKKQEMTKSENSWQRVVIEKPFGRDLQSAQRLNDEITRVFPEDNIYRIDHYLGKEMIQNIMVLRFTNTIFEPIWNSQYIDNIQISSNEQLGVDTRGAYYEKAGALRDMVQNHMMQLLTLTAMEPPIKLDNRSIGDEKKRVLRSLQEYTHESIFKDIVRGQYREGIIDGKEVKSYRQEVGVNPQSSTETFVAMKLAVNNYRWAGVPFYIRTGKRMPMKSTEIIVEFKRPPEVLFFKEYERLQPNILVMRIQPREGVFLRFNAKKPGMKSQIIPVDMDYYQNCQLYENCPDAYERLIYDVMRGDSTLFAHWDEVEYSWRIVDNISLAWCLKPEEVFEYDSGSRGPQAANELLERDNRKWWNV
jgi:glucose-6-phosphate 1-dehydrogenase